MELRHLRYFVALAEELHFGRAAERLGIAPPTLTVQIQEIERSLDVRLFDRTRRSVALTSAGHLFLGEARAALAQFERAQSVGRRAGRGEVGRIEIGYVGSAIYAGFLQEQTSRFRAIRPAVEIRAREWPMADLPGMLSDGTLDIGYVRLPLPLPAGVRRHLVSRDRFCLALPVDHPQAGVEGPVRSRHLAGERFVAPEQPAGTHEVGRRGRFVPEIVSTPGNLQDVLTQVSLGIGVSVVPGVVADVVAMPHVCFRPLAGAPILSDLAMIFRANEPSPVVKAFILHGREMSSQAR